MSLQRAFWKDLATELRAGHRIYLAMVVHHTIHSPGTRGARLFLSASHTQRGTIGGGRMELTELTEARKLLSDPQIPFTSLPAPRILRLAHRKKAQIPLSGMLCAGEQTNLSLFLDPEDPPTLQAIEAIAHLGDQEAGLLRISQDGLRFSPSSPPDAPQSFHHLESAEEGRFSYEEQLFHPKRAVIFGAGHCGDALAQALLPLDYLVTLVDNRPSILDALPPRLGITKLHVVDYLEAAERIPFPAFSPAIVMTTDSPSDIRALQGALRRGFPFLGLMGSPAKIKLIRDALLQYGFSDQEIDHITAPVGLPIDSHTPAEIAISVTAQLLQLRPTLFPALFG